MPTIKKASFEQTETCTFHGEQIEATPKQIEEALGAPSFNYPADSEGKEREEWDRTVDGVPLRVLNHHHYGTVTETTETEWTVEAADGSSEVTKGPTNEYISVQQTPTPTEQEIAQDIRNSKI